MASEGGSSCAQPPVTVTPSTCSVARTTAYSTYTYTVSTTTRYATALPSPLVLSTTYAPTFGEASTLLPTNVTYTTYSLNRNATTSHDGAYGQSAYAALWANVTYNTTVPFTTTVSPTPVPSSDLVFPPALYTACPQSSDSCLDCYKFPKDFIWGLAGSAFQIEGGLQSDGRGPAPVDMNGALPNTKDIANGEVADMNYWLYKQDIARLAAIGIPYYSFSISWTRIVPFGFANTPINQPGLDHYDDVINTCLEYGITPIVTLIHGDYPFNVTYDADAFVESFMYYAKQVITRYGDRLQHIVTFNEANIDYYNTGFTRYFRSIPNILKGHATFYHWYKEELKGTGQITLKFANNLGMPLDASNSSDVAAAQRYQDFIIGILGYPIFLGQNYPATVLSVPGTNLTALTPSELSYIQGTVDFFAFDPYVAQYATAPSNGTDTCAGNAEDPNWPICVVNTNVQQDGWLMGQGSYAYAYLAPQYVRQQLGWIWNTLKPSGILVAEYGFNPFMEYAKVRIRILYPLRLSLTILTTYDAQRYDLERTLYYQWFNREMLKAMYEDGVNVIGALGWSFVYVHSSTSPHNMGL